MSMKVSSRVRFLGMHEMDELAFVIAASSLPESDDDRLWDDEDDGVAGWVGTGEGAWEGDGETEIEWSWSSREGSIKESGIEGGVQVLLGKNHANSTPPDHVDQPQLRWWQD